MERTAPGRQGAGAAGWAATRPVEKPPTPKAVQKRPAEEGPILKRPAHRQPHSNATPRLWRGLREWACDGRLAGLLLALGSAATLAYLFFSPQFQVQAVEVQGNVVLPSQEAIAGSQAASANLFLLDIGQIESRLRQVRYVEWVRVERFLPNRVRLTIQERFPAVSWCNAQTWLDRYLVDNNGVLVGAERPGMSDLIYVVDVTPDAFPLHVGQQVDAAAVQTAQQVFSRLYNDLGIPLLPFEYQQGRGVTAVSAEGWKACFGTSEHLEEKVGNLLALRQSDIPFRMVDLRLPDQIRITR